LLDWKQLRSLGQALKDAGHCAVQQLRAIVVSGLSIAARALNGLLRQSVGVGIVFATNVSDREVLEFRDDVLAGMMNVAESRALAAISSADLPYDYFRIAENLQPGRFVSGGVL
jgi:hypothetical protein